VKTRKPPIRSLSYLAALLLLGLALTAVTPAGYPKNSGIGPNAQVELRRAPRRPPVSSEPDPPRTGFVPPEMDLSHLTGQTIPKVSATLPGRFDWRTAGKVTPVKNQGNCGSCYAFASIANFESALLIRGEGSHDYSENNVKECNWYDSSCSGGNYWEVASFLSKNGTVLDSCDPYVDRNVSCRASCPYQQTLLDWRVISDDAVPNTNVLKTYIQTYGPVYTSMYAGNGDAWETEFQNYTGSYTLYYPGLQDPNHAVLIVGWDDSLTHAGGTGAWIVKNSWGTDWGGTCGYGSERGYFTIAYGSASIGKHSSFVHDWQDYDASGGLMYYDEGGCSDAYGYTGGTTTTAWGLCRFTPTENTYVTRVEFWTTDATTDVDVYLYDDFNASTGTPIGLLHSDPNHSFSEAGYHSVTVDPPLAVTTGDDIVAVVKFANSSFEYPVAVDYQGPCETQRTYLSHYGQDGSWEDLGTAEGVDVAIRLRTSASAPTATPTSVSPSPTMTTPPTLMPSPTPTGTRAPGAMGMFLPIIKRHFPPATPTPTPTITPTPSPTPEWQGRPRDGAWLGQTITNGHPDEPQAMAFETAKNGSKIRAGMDLVTYVYKSIGFWVCWGTATWEIANSIPISANGSFTFSRIYLDGDISGTGRFVSATRAEGTYTTNVVYGVCGNIHNTGTWWATWQGPAIAGSQPIEMVEPRLRMQTGEKRSTPLR